ncbi:tRNA (guanosine(46)-N7)-methyltransferase TrmB [Ectothiorhodospiraceae bacterium 2226]|nr:tRNA (guanosine(46)-N7)-methyltransferase TrmB [Ectothiorhodospiraceae bacterium 2226]
MALATESGPDATARGARPVRSFVRREGRMTVGQQRALEALLPRYGVPAGDAPLDLDALFGRRAPRVLEIGFGMGATLAELAARHPERDYLGIEVHRPGVGSLLMQVAEQGLTNVRVWGDDAVAFLERRIPPASLDQILILFPDPWPKKRHHKRRIVQPPFVALAASRLAAGGRLQLATDWAPYAEHMLAVLGAEPTLRNVAPDGGYIPRPEERPVTKFERRGQRLGHGVWDLAFEKR